MLPPKERYFTILAHPVNAYAIMADIVHSVRISQIRSGCGFGMNGSTRTRTRDQTVMIRSL